jgi:hypothetical protein
MISGNNFTGATGVSFNGVAAYFVAVSVTQITSSVPPGASTGKITVTTPGGSATSASDFSVVWWPIIIGVNPGSGRAGDFIVINGANFCPSQGGNSQCQMFTNGLVQVGNGWKAAAWVQSNWVTFYVPYGATTGPINVITPYGIATGPTFTVLP